MKIFDGEKVRRAAERAKVNALRNYFTIGILEHFMTTLELFETILPKIFKGARAAYHSDCKSSIIFCLIRIKIKTFKNTSLWQKHSTMVIDIQTKHGILWKNFWRTKLIFIISVKRFFMTKFGISAFNCNIKKINSEMFKFIFLEIILYLVQDKILNPTGDGSRRVWDLFIFDSRFDRILNWQWKSALL